MNTWTNFFIAAAGASASLAGLIFVSLSVNINRIIKVTHLPARAAATIGSLILILICSMAVLMPQSIFALGIELLLFSLLAWAMKVWSAYRAFAERKRTHRPVFEALVETTLGQIQVLPFLAGSFLLILGNGFGFYWIAGGVIAVFVFSVLNGWILLVEILR